MYHAKRLLELPNLNLIEAVCWIINLFPREHSAHRTSQRWEHGRDTGREREAKMEGRQRGELRQTQPPSSEPCQSTTRYTTQSGHDVICHIIALVTGLRAHVWGQQGIKKSTFQQLKTNRGEWKRVRPKKEGIKAQAETNRHLMVAWVFVIIVVVGVQS